MDTKRSLLLYRISLVVSALIFLGVLFWVAMRFFEPAPFAEPPLQKSRIVFNPKFDIRSHVLFQGLRAFVTGIVEPGILGRPVPFAGPQEALQLESGQTSRLAIAEEIPLFGGRAIDITPASDGAMLALLAGRAGEGETLYEIRSYAANGSVRTISSWMASAVADLEPVRFAQDSSGLIWLGSGAGRIGTLTDGSPPLWKPETDIRLFSGVRQMVFDDAMRLWVTDGFHVSVGMGEGLTPLDIYGRMTDADRIILGNQLTQIPEAVRPLPMEGPDGLLKASLVPERLFARADGGMSLNTGYAILQFSSALEKPPQLINTLATSSLPIAAAPNGDVWAERYTDGGIIRIWATGTRSYAGAPIPRQAVSHPELFASDRNALFALDYSPTSTVLWSTKGSEWQAQVVAASGTIPADTPVKVSIDGGGNMWAIFVQGGLLRIQKGAESP